MKARIKLRHLQAFTTITRAGSFRAAAEQLLLTQPAISRSMAELEEILGARLLSRDRGGVALTPVGAFFLSFAEASLAALERGISGVGEFAPEAGLSMRIGMQPAAAARLMPAVTRALEQEPAGLGVTLQEGSHADLAQRLRDGQLDLVVGMQGPPETMADLSFVQLYTERLAIVAAPGHPALERPDLQALADWPAVYPPPEDPVRPVLRRFLVGHGVPLPRIRVETGSFAFGLSRTLGGDALWFAPEGMVQEAVARGLLARLPLNTEATAMPAGLIARAGEDQTPAGRRLLPALRGALAAA
ncbi:LysR substrate-binding domain-containing protein [Mangrovicoccus algicola]|uniref:LysR family transcriptional regulator n=1 Tax=Mangrovicoccus algicola TaxID=2771008 RepID=A0A8J6Z064_9RHOB|nr:LysR substrate-binding domain-containing protein [Mangrovicoccus algicola]MBE3639231.1 LysR family transcriptional regulator [Mangrovicoccus algicola]